MFDSHKKYTFASDEYLEAIERDIANVRLVKSIALFVGLVIMLFAFHSK